MQSEEDSGWQGGESGSHEGVGTQDPWFAAPLTHLLVLRQIWMALGISLVSSFLSDTSLPSTGWRSENERWVRRGQATAHPGPLLVSGWAGLTVVSQRKMLL